MLKAETNEALALAAVVFVLGGILSLILSVTMRGNDLFYGVLGPSIVSFLVTWRKLRD